MAKQSYQNPQLLICLNTQSRCAVLMTVAFMAFMIELMMSKVFLAFFLYKILQFIIFF